MVGRETDRMGVNELHNCKLFEDAQPLIDWLNATALTKEQLYQHKHNIWFINALNGNLDDFANDNIADQGLPSEYSNLKNILASKLRGNVKNCNDWNLLLKKRATIHINELFKLYVTNDTLVIASSFNHISAEKQIDKCLNVFKLDVETEYGNHDYRIKQALKEASLSKYKNIFVYLIGTEFETGRRHSNVVYKQLIVGLKKLNKPYVTVMDAAQEMFLYRRDYDLYHYVIGTSHAIYDRYDVGLLWINNNLVCEQYQKMFTGYKRCDVLMRLIWGIDVVQDRLVDIISYKHVIEDCIDWTLFDQFNLHNSQPNFFSLYGSPHYLKNHYVRQFIEKYFIEHAKKGDPGVNVEINYHNAQPQLLVRVRPQTMMFDHNDIVTKFEYFYTNFNKLRVIGSQYEV